MGVQSKEHESGSTELSAQKGGTKVEGRGCLRC